MALGLRDLLGWPAPSASTTVGALGVWVPGDQDDDLLAINYGLVVTHFQRSIKQPGNVAAKDSNIYGRRRRMDGVGGCFPVFCVSGLNHGGIEQPRPQGSAI